MLKGFCRKLHLTNVENDDNVDYVVKTGRIALRRLESFKFGVGRKRVRERG